MRWIVLLRFWISNSRTEQNVDKKATLAEIFIWHHETYLSRMFLQILEVFQYRKTRDIFRAICKVLASFEMKFLTFFQV